MSQRCSNSESGFTLIELMVGLALLGFLGVTMLMGYQLLAESWQRIAGREEASRTIVMSFDFIRERLSQAYPGMIGDDPHHRHVAFTGSAQNIEFLAPLPERFGASAIVWYELRLGDDGTLHVGWRLDQGALTDTVLMKNLRGGSFAYFGADQPGQRKVWTDSWGERKTLPELIRIVLVPGQTQPAGWPPLFVAPLVTASLECVFDPADGKCRG